MKKKTHNVTVHTNGIKVIEQSDNVVKFAKPLPITNNEVQLNGTKYDIDSMDISTFKGLITADHASNLKSIIGKVIGLAKGKNKITIEGIDFAVKENAFAQFAKDMLLGGYATDFSIETIGPWPDEEGVYKNSQLVGLSMVVVGNNKKATVNEIAHNSITKAKEMGLDTSELESIYKLPLDKKETISDNEVMKFKKIKNSKSFVVTLKYKNDAGEEVETKVEPGAVVEVSEDQAEEVQAQVDGAEAPKEEKKEVAQESISEAVKNAVAPLLTKINELEGKVFDNSAEEPMFKKVNVAKVNNELGSMDYKERHAQQINLAWEMLKNNSSESGKKLETINKYHVEKLQEKGIVSNQVTMADFGNFVISPELLTEIEGYRSDFSALLSRVSFKDTLSLQMAWLKRSGDINMQEVEMCDDGEDGNLKPISEYGASIETSNLHELAAVTPVCNAATRFLAVDLLGDVAAGYRNDFDRKKAQLVIARLQQAINETGNSTEFDVSTDLKSLKSLITAIKSVVEQVPNGTFIFNNSTYWTFVEKILGAGIAGPLATIFTTGDQPSFLGKSYIVVPDELMPTLGNGDTKTFVIEKTSVTINQGLIYADLNTFTGRTSGGLNYDLSTEASYEVDGDTRSAFQRNELVLRGSFFRGGAVKNADKVAGLSDFALS